MGPIAKLLKNLPSIVHCVQEANVSRTDMNMARLMCVIVYVCSHV